jgi:hypothetical protein
MQTCHLLIDQDFIESPNLCLSLTFVVMPNLSDRISPPGPGLQLPSVKELNKSEADSFTFLVNNSQHATTIRDALVVSPAAKERFKNDFTETIGFFSRNRQIGLKSQQADDSIECGTQLLVLGIECGTRLLVLGMTAHFWRLSLSMIVVMANGFLCVSESRTCVKEVHIVMTDMDSA